MLLWEIVMFDKLFVSIIEKKMKKYLWASRRSIVVNCKFAIALDFNIMKLEIYFCAIFNYFQVIF